jgi:hypothetical protein
MSKERTVLLRTTSFSVEAAVRARPATVASDDMQQYAGDDLPLLLCARSNIHWRDSRTCRFCLEAIADALPS